MKSTDSRSTPVEALNEQRRLAVRLRLEGVRLREIRERTGLSLPTIIAAHKAYLAAGWAGVANKPRGRAVGAGRKLDPVAEAEVLASLAGLADAGLKHQIAPISTAMLRERILALGGGALSPRTLDHYLQRWGLVFPRPRFDDPLRRRWRQGHYPAIARAASARGAAVVWVTAQPWSGTAPAAPPGGFGLLVAASGRHRPSWQPFRGTLDRGMLLRFLAAITSCTPAGAPAGATLLLDGFDPALTAAAVEWAVAAGPAVQCVAVPAGPESADPVPAGSVVTHATTPRISLPATGRTMTLTHLQRLEAESIHIMREVVAEADNPVMLYSIGKDSAVMLHLAAKAFYPAKPPFPLLHVDTTWKFREMYEFRDRLAAELGFDLLVHINREGLELGINPFTHGSAIHTDVMKTQGLKQALDKYGFDVAFGGARRDEEKSRAKERIFSFRSAQHRWDPKSQRPELWRQYNARKHKGESIRVFPISNWTELDIWQYIHLENIPIVPLYYAKPRPVVERDGALIMVDDARMPLRDGEQPQMRSVRFRTLGCYPLTGAVESTADTLPAIIQEMLLTTSSERQGRVIDHDQAASMEKKKQEGYF